MIGTSTIYCRDYSDITLQDKSFCQCDNEDSEKKEKRPILCRACRAKITTAAQMIEVNGSHRHTFANPHGKVFEIGCFSGASGCINHGPATHDCTWFAGCTWRFSLCANCFTHIGWKYHSTLAGSFFGLIWAQLLWHEQ